MSFTFEVFYLRCRECWQPIQSTGATTYQRFMYENRDRQYNPRTDVVSDRDPRASYPPVGFKSWCEGHDA